LEVYKLKDWKMKIGIIGAGWWGKNLVRVSYELGVLKTVCDIDERTLNDIKVKYNEVKTTKNFDEIFMDKEINGVIISSSAETHYSLVKKAILSGKNVFVEKPLSLKVSDGKEIVELAEKNKIILMVGHILHYHPAVIRMKEMIKYGEIGQIQYIYSNRLNIGRIRNEENILWSFAPHDISLLSSITGQLPDKVFSFGGTYLPHNVEDVTLTFFSFPSGIKGHIFVSWLNPFKEQKFVVVGNKKMIVFDDIEKERKLVVYSHKINWKENEIPTIEKCEGEVIEIEKKEPLKEEIKHFLNCIEKGEKPLTDGREGLGVLAVLEMAEKSLRSN